MSIIIDLQRCNSLKSPQEGETHLNSLDLICFHSQKIAQISHSFDLFAIIYIYMLKKNL